MKLTRKQIAILQYIASGDAFFSQPNIEDPAFKKLLKLNLIVFAGYRMTYTKYNITTLGLNTLKELS
jgi:hypothetical protein